MLRVLLEARWPSGNGRTLGPVGLPRPIAWSSLGLVAFTAPPNERSSSLLPEFPIYIMPFSRPDEAYLIATDHHASIRFLLWDYSGHALLSIDDVGECRLWAMSVCCAVSEQLISVKKSEIKKSAFFLVYWLAACMLKRWTYTSLTARTRNS